MCSKHFVSFIPAIIPIQYNVKLKLMYMNYLEVLCTVHTSTKIHSLPTERQYTEVRVAGIQPPPICFGQVEPLYAER